ncbi:MAG TPA: NADH-quinone oxidoreductase subunit NuoG, partial [Devosiaceae bacterium]|nr:NADH-quinone oxidoreductase subunit NuoG [Devosiaceae bacterium]
KRAVENKEIGPLVKTIMTRCIHCTRCVRFVTEVAGVEELGATGRGEDMEITTYLESAMGSELQGNVIDLCPVGALTSRPYAFQARPWELEKTESIDVMDGLGSAIRVDSRDGVVMRVLPRVNEAVNEEWISDKTRFHWDGLKTQRLDSAFVRRRGKLTEASWDDAFVAVAAALKNKPGNRIGAIAGDLAAVEDMYALKALMTALGSGMTDCRPPLSALEPDKGRASYIFNPTIAGIDQADAILIVGSDPRSEAAVLNARIRKAWRARKSLPIGLIGEPADLTYGYTHIGVGMADLADLAAGKGEFAGVLKAAERPLIIVGESAATSLTGKDPGRDALALAAKIAVDGGAATDDWNGFAVLHNAAGRVGGLDIGFVPHEGGVCSIDQLKAAGRGELDVIFLLGADEFDLDLAGEAFIVYVGSHGDRGAHRADVILPGAAYTEKSGTYVNTEGRVQMALRAVFPPGEAREDWAIFRALSGVLGMPLPFDSLGQLRVAMIGEFPHLGEIDEIAPGNAADIVALAARKTARNSEAFRGYVSDFYLTNPIARASAVMAECSALRAGLKQAAE